MKYTANQNKTFKVYTYALNEFFGWQCMQRFPSHRIESLWIDISEKWRLNNVSNLIFLNKEVPDSGRQNMNLLDSYVTQSNKQLWRLSERPITLD